VRLSPDQRACRDDGELVSCCCSREQVSCKHLPCTESRAKPRAASCRSGSNGPATQYSNYQRRFTGYSIGSYCWQLPPQYSKKVAAHAAARLQTSLWKTESCVVVPPTRGVPRGGYPRRIPPGIGLFLGNLEMLSRGDPEHVLVQLQKD
jgi:hypothetical protein